jgi:hypothetical protein
VFYALHVDAIGAPSGSSLIASSDAAFAALLVSSRFTHAPEAGCANGRGKFALLNAAGCALPPFSMIGVRRG